MARQLMPSRQSFRSVIAAGLIVFGFCLLFAVSPQSQMAQAQLPTASQSNISSADSILAVVSADVRDKTIQFGDALDVVVALQNRGKEPITILPDALVLENKGWTGFPGGGSGMGESALVRVGVLKKETFTLQPGESVTMTGGNVEMAAKTLGPIRAGFAIRTGNEALRQALGTPPHFTVSYSVSPSKLIASAWAAKTPDDRQQLQAEFREILLLKPRTREWRDRFYVEGTLTFMGCYSLPLLETAMKDSDPVVRQSAVSSLSRTAWSAAELNAFVANLAGNKEAQSWLASIGKCDEDHALRESVRLATAGLNDADARVRSAAISVLTERARVESRDRIYLASHPNERTKPYYASIGLIDPVIPLVQKMAADADPGVRSEAQKFLSNFAAQPKMAESVAVSLADANAGVRSTALEALKDSPKPPPMATLEKAFASARGEVALGLIELLLEREDAGLAARLTPGFKDRTPAERLMILTAIAGHADDAALNLVTLGLKDADAGVRRAALMRLLGFPGTRALALIKTNSADFPQEDRAIAAAVQKELESHALFPFLSRGTSSAVERLFPSRQGTEPMVSPDGKWVAYVETGWGRRGGSGGMGRSNLLSLTHVIRNNGTADRPVSDMFLVGWTADSRHIASCRDGFAAIVNLNGQTVAEFGEPLDKPYSGKGIEGEIWPTGDPRSEIGVRMPHTKGLQNRGSDPRSFIDRDDGEDASFSPDGKWFGPRRVNDQWQFMDADGRKIEMKRPAHVFMGSRAIWSPDGGRLMTIPLHASNTVGGSEGIAPGQAFVIDFPGQSVKTVLEIDQVPNMGSWDYRKGRWNPWSRDGQHLAFVRQSQVWVADGDGNNARQVTFDTANKVFPTFSPDGTKVAYITWQHEKHGGYTRLGPTNIWVVDLNTGLSVRVTRVNASHIEDLDWLDADTLIYDRLGSDDDQSGLRTASLR